MARPFAVAHDWEPPSDEPLAVLQGCTLGPTVTGTPIPSEHAPANGWVWLDHDPAERDPYVREDTGAAIRAARFVEVTALGLRAIP